MAAGFATAHPPVSVVADSRGNVYYSDLRHVWRIDKWGHCVWKRAPDGGVTKVIPSTEGLTVSRDGVVFLIDTLDLLPTDV